MKQWFLWILLSGLLFVLLQSSVADEHFYRVAATAGDNQSNLLERYRLSGYQCNFEKFRKLNGLNAKSLLIEGQSYYLPILVYTYNGKSIRTSADLKDWKQALRVKEFNEYMLRKGLRKHSFEDSKILWVPWHEASCIGENTPAPAPPTSPEKRNGENPDLSILSKKGAAETEVFHDVPEGNAGTGMNATLGYRNFGIFGDKYAMVPLESKKLENKVYFIDPGHGGPDVGAIGKRGKHLLYEDEYAYDVSLRVARELLKHGATVYMVVRDKNDGIRDEEYLSIDYDEYCWGNLTIPRQQKARLAQRTEAINDLYVRHRKSGSKEQYMVCIHLDSRSQGMRLDVFFYHHPDSDAGKRLAKHMHQTMDKKYEVHSNRDYMGTVSSRDLFALREARPTGVFIELGNLRNKFDQERFIKPRNRQLVASWIAEGLITYKLK